MCLREFHPRKRVFGTGRPGPLTHRFQPVPRRSKLLAADALPVVRAKSHLGELDVLLAGIGGRIGIEQATLQPLRELLLAETEIPSSLADEVLQIKIRNGVRVEVSRLRGWGHGLPLYFGRKTIPGIAPSCPWIVTGGDTGQSSHLRPRSASRSPFGLIIRR